VRTYPRDDPREQGGDARVPTCTCAARDARRANGAPDPPQVGGEYIEQPCMALYPDERKFSPVYIQVQRARSSRMSQFPIFLVAPVTYLRSSKATWLEGA
jgi:hypothetical protein